MTRIGLTGSVASGKSSVARIWAHAGVPVILADDLAREVVEPGTEGLARVVEAFGPGVLRSDGTLDREGLRGLVFRDEAARKKLEGILHPRIGALRRAWMETRERRGESLVAAEIPLLFEVGLEGEFDAIVVVDAPRGERIRRLRRDRGLAAEEASRIMEAQMPAKEKRERADYVLDNGGSPQALRDRALALLDLLRARHGRRVPSSEANGS